MRKTHYDGATRRGGAMASREGMRALRTLASRCVRTRACDAFRDDATVGWKTQKRGFGAEADPEEAKPPPGVGRGPVGVLSLALVLMTGAGVVYYFDQEKQKKIQNTYKPRSVGRAAIGGPFSLVDMHGKPFTDRDLLGQFSLLYFGFTYCPDICPDELTKMAEAIDKVEDKTGKQVLPVFITVDPERDTPEQIREYCTEFHPRLLGLTGTMDQIKQAARQYRVYFNKTEDGDDYLVDHSIIMYLLDPEGEFITFYGKNNTAEELADKMAESMATWKKA